jgi:hypothetical protein
MSEPTSHVYDADDPVEDFEPLPFEDKGVKDV